MLFFCSRDELLWKSLLYREWKIDRFLPLLPGQSSYFREYRRLKCRVPCHQVQVLREHTDQVLHVSFSHNGKMFASCSKDGTIKVGSQSTADWGRGYYHSVRNRNYTNFGQPTLFRDPRITGLYLINLFCVGT